jgi:histone deacetylase complex regulatory component SIN3
MAGDPPQDALTYVRAVKARFQASNPQTYEAFLEVMRDFKNSRRAIYEH